MDNKLEQLTQKLYEEGLAKGRSEGQRMVAEAEARAAKIVAEAEQKARDIERRAAAAAEDQRKNTLTEISLAGRQAVDKIKDRIAGAIVARSISAATAQAGIDPEFIKEMLLSVAKNWTPGSKISLVALLPEDKRKELDAAFAGSVAALLKEGIEVGYSPDVQSGFRVGEKNGGYYIGFSDENFEALLGGYLREKAFKILYEAK